MASVLKRQNFNVTPEQEAELKKMQETLDAPSIKDAIMRAAKIINLLGWETKTGKYIFLHDKSGSQTRLMLPELDRQGEEWKYLAPRPSSWKKQLFVKGRRVTAANIWYDMCANNDSIEEAANEWDLPIEAIEEIVRYCEANQDLIGMESDEEKRILLEAGVKLPSESEE